MSETNADHSSERNPHKGNRGFTRAWHAANNSRSGLVFALREESAFRQKLTLAACLIPPALLLHFGAHERLMLSHAMDHATLPAVRRLNSQPGLVPISAVERSWRDGRKPESRS